MGKGGKGGTRVGQLDSEEQRLAQEEIDPALLAEFDGEHQLEAPAFPDGLFAASGADPDVLAAEVDEILQAQAGEAAYPSDKEL
eukprot:tig00000227_g19836.t1